LDDPTCGFYRFVISGILRSVEWQFVTDVSVQTIGSYFKGKAAQDEGLFDP